VEWKKKESGRKYGTEYEMMEGTFRCTQMRGHVVTRKHQNFVENVRNMEAMSVILFPML